MERLQKLIPEIIDLAGGEIIGRIRLQKIIYLMDRKGLNSGANYIYYHYGPYSEDVADAISDAKFWGTLEEQTEFRQSDGAPYSVFRSIISVERDNNLGNLAVDDAYSILSKLKSANSTVLELSATIHWLAFIEKTADWRSEIEQRKAGKTANGRLEKAMQLLMELDLAPPAQTPDTSARALP
ncbi:MAG TPA: hypothetical protein PLK13_14810 [Xanthobacteraceae bacterium]|jgi:uncharacterized protein YwgA|nr:hypothetical protein [Xanthobacteraceae bacterium]HQS46077.1 hypothetical protein [Xanthobacteraceae bacterium]